jgi:hypothetical protein
MQNNVFIQGVIQDGYKMGPAVYVKQCSNGAYLSKFKIKHTSVDGRSMFIDLTRFSPDPMTGFNAGDLVSVFGQLTYEKYKDGEVEKYRLAVRPENVEKIQPEIQPADSLPQQPGQPEQAVAGSDPNEPPF